MMYQINDIFPYVVSSTREIITLKVVKDPTHSCLDCYFQGSCSNQVRKELGYCTRGDRKDETDVIFKKQETIMDPMTKPFNLKEAKAGKKVCTKDGKPVRIICWDYKRIPSDSQRLIALIDDNGTTDIHTYPISENIEDLRMVVEQKYGFISLYKAEDGIVTKYGPVYSSREEAVNKSTVLDRIGIFQINYWE